MSAHLDHLGVGRPVNGDSIYNGAMDNASGIATLLETARAFQTHHVRPRRSVIFLAVTGEEEGELGSAYFALHPTVPAAAIVADLNTDMYLPIIPLTGVFVYGWQESDLGKDVLPVLKAHGLKNLEDPEPEQVRFIRSDQYSFIQRGIPALAFKAGYTKDSPEDSTVSAWLSTRYHKPSDDLAQPVNFQTAVKFDSMYYDVVKAIADRRSPDAPGLVSAERVRVDQAAGLAIALIHFAHEQTAVRCSIIRRQGLTRSLQTPHRNIHHPPRIRRPVILP